MESEPKQIQDTEMKSRTILSLLTAMLLMVVTYGQDKYYFGTGDANSFPGQSCAGCHKQNGAATPIYNEWSQTRHAVAQDSVNSQFYNYSCMGCHNTGWDPNIANYGADEYVVYDSTQPGKYRITDPVNFAKVKNVGCESCHGPLGNQDRSLNAAHWGFGTTNKPNYSAALCGSCHQGEHHPYYEEYSESRHAMTTQSSPIVTTNKSCTKCHVAQNFIAYVSDPVNYRDTVLVTGDDIQPITCVACHDPHSNANTAQLRAPVTGQKVICDYCHTSGVETVNVNSTPHHTTAEALSGTPNFGYQYPGQTYQNSLHTFAATERCINCHVQASEGTPAKTGHTFEPRVQACVTCHPDYYTAVDTSNHATRFDYRRTQTVTDSLMNVLTTRLSWATSADSLTDAFKQARYNLLSIQAEGSRGIHNTKLVQKLLRDAIANFIPSDVKGDGSIPNVYNMYQNYPNPFNPVTNIKFQVPERAKVTLSVYDITGKLVSVLANGEYETGVHVVSFNASNLASGIYFYKIEAGKFTDTKKLILMK